MAIEIDVAHVARLARLDLSDDELAHYGDQLGAILEHATQVQAVDTEGLPPTAHPLEITNAYREDEAKPSLDRAEVLSQAPDHTDELFRVPPSMDSP